MSLKRRVRCLLLAAALGATLGVSGCDSPRQVLDAHTLGTAVRGLGSLSSEAGVLADELGQRHVTLSFALAHQQALAQESLKLSEQITKPAPPRLQALQQQAAQLNLRLQQTVLQVARTAPQAEQLAQLRHSLQELSAQAKSLEDAL
jgi:methyl-accepting chemotaxis protein